MTGSQQSHNRAQNAATRLNRAQDPSEQRNHFLDVKSRDIHCGDWKHCAFRSSALTQFIRCPRPPGGLPPAVGHGQSPAQLAIQGPQHRAPVNHPGPWAMGIVESSGTHQAASQPPAHHSAAMAASADCLAVRKGTHLKLLSPEREPHQRLPHGSTFALDPIASIFDRIGALRSTKCWGSSIMLLATDQLADKLEVVQGTILPGEEIGGRHGTNRKDSCSSWKARPQQ